jgi:hypothetical protein
MFPDDYAHYNLDIESVLKVFPHFEDCDALWRGIPSYDTKPFDSAPSTDRTSDFLSIIQRGAVTTPMSRDVRGHQGARQAEVQAQTTEDPLPNFEDDDGAAADVEPEGQLSRNWEIDEVTGEIIYRDVAMDGDGDNGLDDELHHEFDREQDLGEYDGMQVDSGPPEVTGMFHRHHNVSYFFLLSLSF